MEVSIITGHNEVVMALDRLLTEKAELETETREPQRIGIDINYRANDNTPTLLDIVATTEFSFQSSDKSITLFEGNREIVIWDCEVAEVRTGFCSELGKDVIMGMDLRLNVDKALISLDQLYFLDSQK